MLALVLSVGFFSAHVLATDLPKLGTLRTQEQPSQNNYVENELLVKFLPDVLFALNIITQ